MVAETREGCGKEGERQTVDEVTALTDLPPLHTVPSRSKISPRPFRWEHFLRKPQEVLGVHSVTSVDEQCILQGDTARMEMQQDSMRFHQGAWCII